MSTRSLDDIANAGRRIGWADRRLMGPACVHFDLLATSAEADISNVRKLAILMWLCWTWQCVLFANAARVMLSPTGEWSPAQAGLAMLVSTMILLADALIFIAASWHVHGLAELARTGQFKPHSTIGVKVKSGVLILTRFAMAMLIANFLAVIAALLGFQNDIRRVIEAEYQRQNAVVYAASSSREDGELRRMGQQVETLGQLIAGAETEIRGLGATMVEPMANDPELRLALDRVSQAQTAKTEADRALVAAETASANEVGGRCGQGLSCKAGAGPRWRAAQERIASAKRAVAEAARTLDAAQSRLRELQNARARDGQRKGDTAKVRLAEVSASKREHEQQLAALTGTYEKRMLNRERRIREAVESDPRHVVRDEGLVARLRALKVLMEDSSVATMVYVFDGILVFLELAAVIGKTVAYVPMSYATMLVERDLTRSYGTAWRLSETIARGPSPPPERPGLSPAVPPEPRSGSDGMEATPAQRSRRHAARWKPPARLSGSQRGSDSDGFEPAPA